MFRHSLKLFGNNMKKITITHCIIAALLIVFAAFYLLPSGDAIAENSEQQDVPEVDVQVLTSEKLRIWTEFSGRLAAVEDVEVKPRVSGAITDILFEEGAIVKKGDALFIIDERPYKAAHASAKAALVAAQSQVKLTRKELERARKLVKQKFVSQARYDAAHNEHKVALANVNAAKARMEEAALNVEFAHIKSPVDGRVSRAEITLGNVIEAGVNAPVLTTVVSSDTMFVEFDVDEQTYIKSVRGGKNNEMPVEMSLSGDDEVYYGTIHSFDNQLDVTSGTIRARAIIDNKDGALIPGMFANVRLGSAEPQGVLLVSDKAVGTDQNKKFVMVVSADNIVEYREVELGETVAKKRVVLNGLSAGERVLINSIQRVRPGMKVTPVDEASSTSENDET